MKKSPSIAASLVVALLVALPLCGQAGMISLTGDTTNSPAFNRPTETGALSFQNPRYSAYVFTVSLTGAYSLSLVANNPSVYDTYLHLYQGAFNPADPEGNFLRANDDAPAGTDAGSSIPSVALTAGTPYYYVADGFSSVDYGAFRATISGPGNISIAAVPEPASLVTLNLAALGLGLFVARRRRRNVFVVGAR